MNQKIGPDKVLRGIALGSLVAWGVAAIYRMQHIGPYSPTAYASQLSATTGYFFFAFVLFGLFYGQYVWIPRVLKRELNVLLGSIQAFSSLTLSLFGLFPVWAPDLGASGRFTADNMLVTIAILGEALFIVNVCWTVMQPQSAARPLTMAAPAGKLEPAALQAEVKSAVPLQAQKLRKQFDWSRWLKPENPVEKFGVTAMFLTVGGLLIVAMLPESRFLILFGGQKHFVTMGVLWWICAVPFAIFSLAYWFHAGRRSVPYDKWMTKFHLGLTFLWLLDFVRIVTMAQMAMMSRMPDLFLDNYTFELYVLLGASAALFFVNVRATARAAAK